MYFNNDLLWQWIVCAYLSQGIQNTTIIGLKYRELLGAYDFASTLASWWLYRWGRRAKGELCKGQKERIFLDRAFYLS